MVVLVPVQLTMCKKPSRDGFGATLGGQSPGPFGANAMQRGPAVSERQGRLHGWPGRLGTDHVRADVAFMDVYGPLKPGMTVRQLAGGVRRQGS